MLGYDSKEELLVPQRSPTFFPTRRSANYCARKSTRQPMLQGREITLIRKDGNPDHLPEHRRRRARHLRPRDPLSRCA